MPASTGLGCFGRGCLHWAGRLEVQQGSSGVTLSCPHRGGDGAPLEWLGRQHWSFPSGREGCWSVHAHWPSFQIPSSLARLLLLKNNPKALKTEHDFQNTWVMDMGERARTSPSKAENYLEGSRHRLSFEGLDLCTWCLMKIWEKERGNIFISQKNWCKTCQYCS